MEILRDVSIDWLSKKWYFLAASGLLLLVGAVSYAARGGLKYGIDFTGGTIIYLKFNERPDLEMIRTSLKPETVGTAIIQRFGDPADNSVQVRLQTVLGTEESVDVGQKAAVQLLRQTFDPANVGSAKADINNIGLDLILGALLRADPEGLAAQNRTQEEVDAHYRGVARALLNHRDKTRDGLVGSLDDFRQAPGVSAAVVGALGEAFYAGPFSVKGMESVGAIVGSDLQRRALFAVGLSALGMLVYIAFRFQPIYGVATIVALVHDIVITLGLFALTEKEVSLAVIAGLLTLIGYSVNDSIVVFDRVRENTRLYRKESGSQILNLSINHTLARTVMTSGMTFISVLALFLFGGAVLNAFSFVLTIGIIVGTYSSIAIAAPIVEWWIKYTEKREKRRHA